MLVGIELNYRQSPFARHPQPVEQGAVRREERREPANRARLIQAAHP